MMMMMIDALAVIRLTITHFEYVGAAFDFVL